MTQPAGQPGLVQYITVQYSTVQYSTVQSVYMYLSIVYILVSAVGAGAHMGFSAGWEVPLWYSAPGSAPSYQPSFFRTNWQLEQVATYLQYLQYL